MLELDDETVAKYLAWPDLISAIERAIAGSFTVPPRESHALAGAGGNNGRLLIMPAWQGDAMLGIKIVTVWPDNPARGKPSHGASYILINPRTGETCAVLAAEALTHRRTAAVSVIAARRLLRSNARRLLVVGTGPVAEQLVCAHAASGRFDRIDLFGRTPEKTAALAAKLDCDSCHPVDDLERAARQADMLVSATSATTPLLKGEWLRDDAHVDLIGSFTPVMRESDDSLITRASQIWVDTMQATTESGDLTGPLERGILTRQMIRGDLGDLVTKPLPTPHGLTVFKAVGTAVADLAAAALAFDRATEENGDPVKLNP